MIPGWRPGLIGMLALMTACSPWFALPASYPPVPPAEPAELRAYEATIVRLVNEDRAVLGLAPLEVDPLLVAIALGHSADMAEGSVDFGHEGFEDRADRAIEELGVRRVGENVAVNNFRLTASPGRVLRDWLGSPPHRENIEGLFDLTGVGVVQSQDGRFFVTQMFAHR